MRGALSVAACAATPGADARHRSSWPPEATSAPRAVRRRASPPAQPPLGPGLCPSANGRWAQVQARPAPADPSGWAAVRHDVQRAVLGLTILAGQPPGGSQRFFVPPTRRAVKAKPERTFSRQLDSTRTVPYRLDATGTLPALAAARSCSLAPCVLKCCSVRSRTLSSLAESAAGPTSWRRQGIEALNDQGLEGRSGALSSSRRRHLVQ